MARSHLYKPIQDAQGNLRIGAQVRVFAPGSATLTTVPLYEADSGTAQKNKIFTTSTGIIDFYTEEPARFRIGVKVGDEPEVFFENVDCLEPPEAAVPSGAVLGRAGVAATFPSGMAKDTNIKASSLSLYTDEGDHGVSVSGTEITVQAGLYIVSCPVGFQAIGSAAGLEVHSLVAFDSPGVGRSSATSFNTMEAWVPGVRLWQPNATSVSEPTVAFLTTSVVARTFNLFANVWEFEFVRLDPGATA